MGWFSSSSPAPATPQSQPTPAQPNQPENLACELKPAASSKPKPCCVCKEEKSARDECMLFSQADDPQEDCKSMVDKYRSCMKGYGFNIA